MSFLILLSVFSASLAANVPHARELKDTVSAYWDLMTRNEKGAALKFVLDSCQNDFINRAEPKIRTWRYVSAKSINNKEAEVTVEMEALFRGAPISAGFQKLERRETWVWHKNKWKLKVEKPSVAAVAPLFAERKTSNQPKVLQISPTVLKIQFLNKAQIGRVRIRNGTELPAELVSAAFDETRFELVTKPASIKAGQTAELTLRYKGTENDKNLESKIGLVLKHGDQEKLFQVPIIYNHLSDGARALFGLTEEQARNLKRGDKIRPVVRQPANTGAPPQPLSQP